LAGDYVLRELSGIVAHNLRREDVLSRYGGEEFAVILPEIDKAAATQVCEKLRRLIAEHQFSFASTTIPVTVSLGIRSTQKTDRAADVNAFIADADAKLYEAKQGGRNRVCA